ncbi:MAG TPA: SCO family protein [Steroidobacteraceae bacterium]
MQTPSWIVAWAAAAITVGVGTALYMRFNEPVSLRSGTALPDPRPIGEFSLVDQDGRPFGRAALENRWSLVFTGFTNCPDLCPTTLALLASLRSRLPGNGLQVVFVSVDPERDTPERIAAYLAHFDPGLIGATGTRAEIERFTNTLGLAQVRNPGIGGEYTVDHSAALVLIDPKARVAGYFRPPHDERALAADLARLNSY